MEPDNIIHLLGLCELPEYIALVSISKSVRALGESYVLDHKTLIGRWKMYREAPREVAFAKAVDAMEWSVIERLLERDAALPRVRHAINNRAIHAGRWGGYRNSAQV